MLNKIYVREFVITILKTFIPMIYKSKKLLLQQLYIVHKIMGYTVGLAMSGLYVLNSFTNVDVRIYV